MDRYHYFAAAVHAEVDPYLKFKSTHCGGWHFLVGKPHIFIGHMAAWCQDQQAEIAVSLSEMTYISLGATFWIKGFLAGPSRQPLRRGITPAKPGGSWHCDNIDRRENGQANREKH